MIKIKELLLTELTQRQKELKKDYLFKQTKMVSSNTVPTWTEVWKVMQRNGDGIARYLDDFRRDAELHGDAFNEREALADIEDDQRHKYFNIVELYKSLNGEPCWREIVIPRTVDPRRLNQLGIHWAITESSAEAHWEQHSGKPTFKCIYEARIDLNIMDWTGTMFARMDYTLGDDENEIRFLKNAKIFVYDVVVYDNLRDGVQKHDLNRERRT